MVELKHILVATDFSPRANRAVKRAAALARQHHATLSLLHVVSRNPLEALARLYGPEAPKFEKRIAASVQVQLQQTADLLRSHFGVEVAHHVAMGRAHIEIGAYAKARGVDLIVVGAHGESFVRDLFLGSTASKVLRLGSGPILVVRTKDLKPYRDVLVGVDFSKPSKRALEAALKLAPDAAVCALNAVEITYEGRLRTAGASEEDIQRYRAQALDEGRRQLDEFLRSCASKSPVTPAVVYGYPPAVIVERAAAMRADLIVVGKHGMTEIEEALLGSVSKHVVYEAGCDVLMAG